MDGFYDRIEKGREKCMDFLEEFVEIEEQKNFETE